MTVRKPVIVGADMLTPCGSGADSCWDAVMANRSAISLCSRYDTSRFISPYAATIDGLEYHGRTSLAEQMLERLFAGATSIPADAPLLLATAKGEIDLLEMAVERGEEPSGSCFGHLLAAASRLAGTRSSAAIVSAACTSASAAVARAATAIVQGETECMLVVACDGVTEFIHSGFSSLMALDPVPARPFDRDRHGLTLGESAAWLLLMSEERAVAEKRTILGELAGWGLSNDANHMTSPSRQSAGLVNAIGRCLAAAGASREQVGFISAHGTGTVYNDAMELGAFHEVFGESSRPLYSIKGAVGHTMGAAGLLEVIIALRALGEGRVPPTTNLCHPDDAAVGWAATESQAIRAGARALVTNVGFGGVNTALLLAGRG